MTLEDKPGLVFAGVDHGDQSPLCLTAPAFAAGCCHLRCDGGAAHLGRECLGYMDTHSDYYSPLCRIDLVSSRCFHDLRGDASTREALIYSHICIRQQGEVDKTVFGEVVGAI